MIIFILYLVFTCAVPWALYFAFGKSWGLDWGFGEFILFLLFPILSYIIYLNLLFAGKSS
jgi:hypothetical protein